MSREETIEKWEARFVWAWVGGWLLYLAWHVVPYLYLLCCWEAP